MAGGEQGPPAATVCAVSGSEEQAGTTHSCYWPRWQQGRVGGSDCLQKLVAASAAANVRAGGHMSLCARPHTSPMKLALTGQYLFYYHSAPMRGSMQEGVVVKIYTDAKESRGSVRETKKVS